MPGLIILAALVIIGIIAAFAFGFLRFTRKQQKEEDQSADMIGFGKPEPEEEEPEELVNLVEYYADYEDEETEPVPEPPKAPEYKDEKYDKLCNLRVGRGYLQEAQTLLNNMRESGQKYAFCHFDFNRFSYINSLKGYSTGDYAITRIAQEAQAIFPEGALLSRLSADHFTALFVYSEDNQLQEAYEMLKRAADRIRTDIGSKGGLQICMGVALANIPQNYDIFLLSRRANIARYSLKGVKAENYSTFDENMMTTYLFGESALENFKEYQYADDYQIYLRPHLLLSTKRITSCESSARWVCEEGSDNPLSADGSQMPSGGLAIIYQVAKAISRWRKAGNIIVPTMVALNEIDILKEDIDAFFLRCLSEFQLEANMLVPVVSLHTVRLAPDLMKGQLQKLRNIGLKIAISDIDRATTMFQPIEDFRPDYLKLHSSFAHDADKIPERQEDVRRIQAIAANMGAATLFEGADNAATVAFLTEAGATFAQGRYVGRANVPDDFAAEVRNFLQAETNKHSTVVLDDATLAKGDFKLY